MNISLHKLLIAGWCATMTVVSGFLVAEYRFFKSQAQQLEQLKGDYAHHLEVLKKRVHDQKEKPKESESKHSVAQELLVVNRALKHVQATPSYTVKARKVQQKSKTKRKRVAKNKRIVKRKKPALMNSQLRKIQREPIFSYPLNRAHFWLSSPYGPRKNPDGSWGFHTGIDMAAQRGTPVMAAGAGRVVEATYSPGYGNTIVIEHNRKFKTRYAHLDKMFVRVGQEIKQGQHIGKVGATGFVRKSRRGGDGSHLHFEVYVFGKHMNPFYFLA